MLQGSQPYILPCADLSNLMPGTYHMFHSEKNSPCHQPYIIKQLLINYV